MAGNDTTAILQGTVSAVIPSQPAPSGSIPADRIDPAVTYPFSVSEKAGFTMKKNGPHFTVYYHNDDDSDADRTLTVLEQAGVPLYQHYFGYEPSGIMILLTGSVDEYIAQSRYPGESRNVIPGSGNVRDGMIILFKPFGSDEPGHSDGMIVHEGSHAALYRYLGPDGYSHLPDFLDEGLAHHAEYVLIKGPAYDPLATIHGADILIQSLRTGSPYMMTLDQLARRCGSYGELSYQCRTQGTYTVWYVEQTYGNHAWAQVLATLNATHDWEESLSGVTGKTTGELGRDIVGNMTAMERSG
jgi:hypothetical protein